MGEKVKTSMSSPLPSDVEKVPASDGIAGISGSSAEALGHEESDVGNDSSVQGDERQAKVVNFCAAQMDVVNDLMPEWFEFFEDSQAFSAPREDIMELLRTAPTPFAQGLMYGIFLMRQELAFITGREFL